MWRKEHISFLVILNLDRINWSELHYFWSTFHFIFSCSSLLLMFFFMRATYASPVKEAYACRRIHIWCVRQRDIHSQIHLAYRKEIMLELGWHVKKKERWTKEATKSVYNDESDRRIVLFTVFIYSVLINVRHFIKHIFSYGISFYLVLFTLLYISSPFECVSKLDE